MRHLLAASFGFCAAIGSAAVSDEVKSRTGVVVELYTSQGCSSCPPADDFFAVLAQTPGVIPLALHVDYWDYIGWEDQFANSTYTDRQKAYARATGSRMIYTPQMIVGGTERVEGNRPDEVSKIIHRQMEVPQPVALKLDRIGDSIDIAARALAPLDGPVRVQLVRYRPEQTVVIERGENAGRTVTYRNIVTSWEPLGDWTGEEPLNLKVFSPGEDPVVVLLQKTGPGEIVAAATTD
ncbi:DUF1223 domain-containing protein [Tabrizicola sp. J26]|uniref:DUF1223 domain-containing protein n=1 Tax=Alitabrizicola rongguiensis TaxID=2909234 RepID=UPI001F1BECA0|nr:DUF1223 domain-containing protein [Tabrizicola rongguiensis]MCF1709652.1 DUF1223 domain-containing protein [Tabrizicola rongguiensis]